MHAVRGIAGYLRLHNCPELSLFEQAAVDPRVVAAFLGDLEGTSQSGLKKREIQRLDLGILRTTL